MLNNKIMYIVIYLMTNFLGTKGKDDTRDQFSRMFKNDGRVNSPLNKSPISTKSFLAIVIASSDNSSSVNLSTILLIEDLGT